MKRFALILAAASLLPSSTLLAQNANFLSDYSKLASDDNSGFTLHYIAPGGADRLANITGIMVDQPEIFLAPDSKYKGFKASDALEVSEILRAAVIEGIQGSMPVVDEATEGTALFSWAVTNIRLEKKKRGILGYTPVGAVAYGVKTQMSDVVDKTRAFDARIEVEVTDAITGEVLFAMVFDVVEAGVEAEWGQALILAEGLGRRVGCRINNSRLDPEDRADCLAIPVSVQ